MVTLSDSLVDRLRDYFTPGELVDYLGLTHKDVLDEFEAEVFDVMDEIEELLGIVDENERG
jgi:hypothetical protein